MLLSFLQISPLDTRMLYQRKFIKISCFNPLVSPPVCAGSRWWRVDVFKLSVLHSSLRCTEAIRNGIYSIFASRIDATPSHPRFRIGRETSMTYEISNKCFDNVCFIMCLTFGFYLQYRLHSIIISKCCMMLFFLI